MYASKQKMGRQKKKFLDFCEEHNVTGVAGHRSATGFRVSLYNAIRAEDVEYLVRLMKEFEQINLK